ncbi:NYN domain-containing protein [Dietzia psychralcaliphila]|uniref:NYN domain-containing protein n=1 Tax=Dietzia psychralcaliphila TaxID=139021 RepID=UPI001C1E32E6|nr:NYN domain-containing protein [Dietzia psychralcaliphila]
MNKTSAQNIQTAEAPAPTNHHKMRPPSLRGRRLILIDIENISGGAIRTLAEARWAQRMLDSTLRLRHQEQVIVGVSKAGAIHTGPVWSSARIVVGTGVDGADHALLDVLNNENIADRFDEVILVSGDGIFTDTVATLGGHGVEVTVVAHRTSLAKKLQMAASQTVTFTPRQINTEGAA